MIHWGVPCKHGNKSDLQNAVNLNENLQFPSHQVIKRQFTTLKDENITQ